MLYNLFIRNKKRWIIFISTFIFILAAILIFNTYIVRKRYEEQTFKAQDYLESGNLKEAIEAYNVALSMKYGDKELLSLGLADAYARIHDYDRALEVLRNRYGVEQSIAVKEKIEEITIKKADYQFYQFISYGDAYFSNGEYSKAIDEYEQAKQIKSREVISYLKIVESYIEMEEYDLASEEIEEGLALTESERLKQLRNEVDNSLKEKKYNEILNIADEYIYQENYEEAINKFNEAIRLIPRRDLAYNQMADLYITIKDYDTAKALLHNYLRSNTSETSNELLQKVNELIAERTKQQRVLNELYTALNVIDIEVIIEIMEDSFFIEKIATEAPVYYNPYGKMNENMGYGILIAGKNDIYFGGFRDMMKEGIGIQFILNDNEDGWYYYQGEWNYDTPNGMGKTGKGIRINNDGKWDTKITETSGMFSYGFESGEMHKMFFENGQIKASVNYTVVDGVAKAYLNQEGQEVPADRKDHYVIGEIYRDNKPTGEYYSIKVDTKLKVELYNP